MVEDERYPVRACLAAAPGVDAAAQDLGAYGRGHRHRHRGSQHRQAPRVVIIQDLRRKIYFLKKVSGEFVSLF